MMKLRGTEDELWAKLGKPATAAVLAETAHMRSKMKEYQYAALYWLARPYEGGRILEIGTFKGRSALILSSACPKAEIITLEPYRFDEATRNTRGRGNITVVKEYSWDYLAAHPEASFHLVLVDGDHQQALRDTPWFNRLVPGGLILFHDYSPKACPPVYQVVNAMAQRLGREPDVLVMDDEGIGMAGFYRGEREMLRKDGGLL